MSLVLNSSLKILHVIPYFAPAYGGPVQAVRDIARMQAESGIAVEIATTTANGGTELRDAERESVIAGNVAVHYFERTFPRGWFSSPTLRDWLARHAADYDGLHLHVPFTHPLRCGVRAARRAGVPYAITPHGVLDTWSLAHKRWKKRPYLDLVERPHLAGARLLHVTSGFEAQGLRALGITDLIRCIPLAVTLPVDTPERTAPAQGLRLLFLSRLHPVKDLRTLLRALAYLERPDIRLTIAGEGERKHTSELITLARELGVTGAISFTGHLHDAAKRQAWQAHDVFVLPSLHENFSLSTIEAMATGMPAIVTDQVGVAGRIAATGAGRVVRCADPRALAAAIAEMLDAATRRHAGEQARLLVEHEFSTTVVQAAYAGFAADLTGKIQHAAC